MSAGLGARAALDFQLLLVDLDLGRLERRKADLLTASAIWARTMQLPGQTKLQCLAKAEECSLKAFWLDADIARLKLQRRNIESQLKSVAVQVAPLVTAEMCAGQDDTMNFRAEAA